MLHAVILAGGSGTRFWPLSRRSRPKQLLRLVGGSSLLRQSLSRLEGLVEASRTWVITTQEIAQAVRAEVPEVPESNVFAEPEPRDTALAVGVAAALIAARDPDAVLIVSPADHVIQPAAAFRDALAEAEQLARGSDRIVTLGVQPSSPHTGYGYIRRGAALAHQGRLPAFEVEAFEEKPDLATAQAHVAGGRHSWNSGVFVWSAKTVLAGLAAQRPALHQAAREIAAAAEEERAEVCRERYASAERVSIDYALLEHATNVVVLTPEIEWSDIGAWSALPALLGSDAQGNTLRGRCVASEAKGCIVQGDEAGAVVLLGVQDLIVVRTSDAVLVARRDREQEIKALVARLEAEGHGDLL